MAILYRTGWIILMILVVAPGFIMAGQVDGITYTEACSVVMENMHNWFSMPWEIAALLSPVVAFAAQLFPASSAIAVMAGEMVWEHLGVILTFLFFATIKPPFYAKIQKKYELQGQTA
ncbi:hypothetical protein NOV18_08615 [Pseudomonas asiatica]|uniref:Uncharacterized protein n=1 Tax=Pseudomonas asiatica TaxID=2219225 RepID=A0AAJ5HZR7_9PSED|nr:hypothetical protein [Pseudomonas asiatica]UUC20527.1 hypothetical protein NOV18_08615 [Pseudomonas asiatica]